ncbi:baseplate J/gp47 family protein [Anaerocolumna aminovalerica]|uniref:baseplate J/gp47 family protein n=1 Tax=Anaerocolumna aminovalerica TaxID=1527 RepID=UPI001C0EF1C1|nr:baseplate J/gp47 family protein [Anaerocolumna aminovalerica]
MFENITFDYLIERMLTRVKNIDNTIDTSEGSLIYSALAPEAWELAEAYIAISTVYDNTFADTAPREELVLRAKERGISPKPATAAVRKGVFNIDIPVNSRFSLDELNYITIEKIDTGMYKMQCETEGTTGNKKFGELTPIEYIEGLESAELTEVLIPGTDEEETEEFRARYFNSFQSLAFGGNRADYIEKINSIPGIGGAKVYRVSGQDYNVLAYIINSEYRAPSNELISETQEVIDPTKSGEGVGMAPIGHIVSIQGVEEVEINISTSLTLDEGYIWEDVSSAVNAAIDSYLLSLSKTWADTENIIVRVSQLEAKILDVAGILDISETQINGDTSNITLSNKQIPIRGIINANT